MMRVMDGLTFCSKLKSHPLTSHIPVILLTARSSGLQQAEGLSMGADAYITKPFDAKVLIAQIDSLLMNRRHLRELIELPRGAREEHGLSADVRAGVFAGRSAKPKKKRA